jgi:hypothetical protein
MKLPTIEKFDSARHSDVGPCPWQITAQQIRPGTKPCSVEFVVMDPFANKPAAYCRTHLATQLESDERLRAALLVQLAEKLL